MEIDLRSKEYFNYCIDNGKPYFGLVLYAQQQSPTVCAYMDKLVAQECSGGNIPYYILEIGSYAGMSTVTWIKAIQRYNSGNGSVLCVDPWLPYLKEKQDASEWDVSRVMNRALKDGQAFRLFLHNIETSGCGDNITIFSTESDKVLSFLKSRFSLSKKKFDLIYIDGNHDYKQFKRDLTNSIPLLKNQGILCGDDFSVNHPGISKALDEIFEQVFIWKRFWAVRKDGEIWKQTMLDITKNIKMPKHLKKWEIGEEYEQN